jgi:hypothetical protein
MAWLVDSNAPELLPSGIPYETPPAAVVEYHVFCVSTSTKCGQVSTLLLSGIISGVVTKRPDINK